MRTPRWSGWVLCVAMSPAATVWAAKPKAAPPKPVDKNAEQMRALEQQLQRNLAAMDQLQKRLGELEKRPSGSAVTPVKVVAAEPEAPAPAPAAPPKARAAAAGKAVPEGLQVGADVGLVNFSKPAAGRRSGATVGGISLRIDRKLGSNVRALAEWRAAYDAQGVLNTDIERAQIGYAFGDDHVVWAGKFLTPLGFWNTAYPASEPLHGPHIQGPRFLASAERGGVMPVYSVGLWGNGQWQTGYGTFQYDAFASNGHTVSGGKLLTQVSGSSSGRAGGGFTFSWTPWFAQALKVGLQGYKTSLPVNSPDGTKSSISKVSMLGGFLKWEAEQYSVVGEYFKFANRSSADPTKSYASTAMYLQGSYNVMPHLQAFVRTERAQLFAQDPFFAYQDGGSAYRMTALGLRYEVDPQAAFKLQWDDTKEDANPTQPVRAVRAQYAVQF